MSCRFSQGVHSAAVPGLLSDTTLPEQLTEADDIAMAEANAPVKTSLLAATAAARKGVPKETEDQKRLKEEQEMLHNITNRTALKTFAELAQVRVFMSDLKHCKLRSCCTDLRCQ